MGNCSRGIRAHFSCTPQNVLWPGYYFFTCWAMTLHMLPARVRPDTFLLAVVVSIAGGYITHVHPRPGYILRGGGPLKYTLSATHTSSIQRRDFFAFGSRVGDDRHTVPSPPAALHHGAGSEPWDITRLFIGPASVHRLFRCATHV